MSLVPRLQVEIFHEPDDTLLLVIRGQRGTAEVGLSFDQAIDVGRRLVECAQGARAAPGGA